MLSIVKFVLVILLGWFLRKCGILKKSDIPTLSAVMVSVTLPCALAAGTQSLSPDVSLLALGAVGFVIGAGMLCVGRLAGRTTDEQMVLMVNLSSLNIGSFSVPVLQGMVSPAAVAYAGMYDIGNSCYGNGASYLIPKAMKEGGGFRIGPILRKLSRSVPMVTYLVFMTLAFAGIHLPDSLFDIVRSIGNCNFLVVFLIAGIAMDLRIDRAGMKTVLKFLVLKYGIGALLAAAVWFWLPFDLTVRQAVIVCILTPQASTSVAYCEMLGCDAKVYSAVYTFGIVASLCAYAVLGILWTI